MDEVQTGIVGAEGAGVGSVPLSPIGVTDQRGPLGSPRFRLTERDLDILKFLHEQQFASLPMLYFRFFDRREKTTDPCPENLWVTRQRVALLRQAGLVASQKLFTEAKALYLLSKAGYEVLRRQRELSLDAEPPESIDFRYYEHDKRVSLCRIALERSGKSEKWYPDRFLRQKKGYPFGAKGFVKFPHGMIPDGVFISARHERVSFELELTPKKRERYAEKRDAYFRFLLERDSNGEPPLHRAVFVACTDRIGKDLSEFFHESERFRVIQYESLVGGTLGKEALG